MHYVVKVALCGINHLAPFFFYLSPPTLREQLTVGSEKHFGRIILDIFVPSVGAGLSDNRCRDGRNVTVSLSLPQSAASYPASLHLPTPVYCVHLRTDKTMFFLSCYECRK